MLTVILGLEDCVTGLAKVSSKRCTLPVLTHLKIGRTKDGWITLTSTDLDSSITYRLEQQSDGEALSLLVSHDELLKIAKSYQKSDSLLVNINEKTVTIE